MAKRGKKKLKKVVQKPSSSGSRRIKMILGNLVVFIILFLISLILSKVFTSDFYVNFFLLLTIIFGFISLAFIIVYLILVFSRSIIK